MCSVVQQYQLFVGGIGCFGESVLGYVQVVSFVVGNYQQWLVDEFDLVGGVLVYQVQQVVGGVVEGGVGMGVCFLVVCIVLLIQIERKFGDLCVSEIGVVGVQYFVVGSFLCLCI